MIQVPVYVKTNNNISLCYEGEDPIMISSDSIKFQKLVDLLNNQDWEGVRRVADSALTLEYISEGKMRYKEHDKSVVEVLTEDGWKLVPKELGQTIVRFLEKELPFGPLVNFAINLLKNPSTNSVKQLFNFIDANKYAITEDGCFIGYRKIANDWKDLYTGTMDNSIGAIVEMPREKVLADPNITCGAGIHCGGFEYTTKHYGTGVGARLVYCKVNPMDVVSVPVDYNNGKLRCCRLQILGELVQKEEVKDDLYSDDKGFHSGEDFFAGEVEFEEFGSEDEELFI
jgi:hypothetical protein